MFVEDTPFLMSECFHVGLFNHNGALRGYSCCIVSLCQLKIFVNQGLVWVQSEAIIFDKGRDESGELVRIHSCLSLAWSIVIFFHFITITFGFKYSIVAWLLILHYLSRKTYDRYVCLYFPARVSGINLCAARAFSHFTVQCIVPPWAPWLCATKVAGLRRCFPAKFSGFRPEELEGHKRKRWNRISTEKVPFATRDVSHLFLLLHFEAEQSARSAPALSSHTEIMLILYCLVYPIFYQFHSLPTPVFKMDGPFQADAESLSHRLNLLRST